MKKISLVFSLLFLGTACSMQHTHSTIRTETLISSSAEKISFPITDAASLSAIENWLKGGDKPSAAEVTCIDNDNTCNAVKELLHRNGVPFNEITATAINSSSGKVSLTYNRLIAKDCVATNFGCATSINSIHMVTNREQFIKPAISDLQDAASAVKTIDK